MVSNSSELISGGKQGGSIQPRCLPLREPLVVLPVGLVLGEDTPVIVAVFPPAPSGHSFGLPSKGGGQPRAGAEGRAVDPRGIGYLRIAATPPNALESISPSSLSVDTKRTVAPDSSAFRNNCST